ncbi:hypothetical protein Slin15195_G124550 [Septoria linicola]|uniref:Uncharacterized protein n=1 Tax=Septoria linicola TaxID=215465 RepID=A0A9Q9B8R5_9PEZI|nr:hypothetical protein Slin15195_G124550 [Septoria linicola]
MAEKLPKELVLQILEYMVLDTMSHVYVHDHDTVRIAARELLGESPATEILMPLSIQAVLEQSILAFDVDFRRTEQNRFAVLPSTAFSLPHPLRKMLLTLDFEIPIGRQKYPAVIYTAKSGMHSLLSQLPGLRKLHVLLSIELTRPPWDHRGSALDVLCRKGFSETTTFRHAVEELLDAARVARPELEIFLEIKYVYEGAWRGVYESLPQVRSPFNPTPRRLSTWNASCSTTHGVTQELLELREAHETSQTYNVALGTTSEAAVREADAKWQECHFSQG